jgi:hypothetical protein
MAPEVEIPLAQVERMEAGSVFHDRFAHVVTAEPFREQRVNREDIVGKIDIYKEHPVELKTTASPPGDLAKERPTYLLQLLFYCAMVGKPRGEIVVVSRSSPEVKGFDTISAYRVEVADLGAVWAEAIRRRDLLRDALDRKDLSGLPGCSWFGRCVYGGICGCERGASESDQRIISLARVDPDPDEEARLRSLLATSGPAAWSREAAHLTGPPPLRLRDLAMPRRRMIEHVVRSEGGEKDAAAEGAPGASAVTEDQVDAKLKEMSSSTSFSGMRRRVFRAMGVSYSHKSRGALDDPWVPNMDGVPVKFKMTRLRRPVDRTDVIRMFPDEVAELGAAAGLLEAKSARLVLYYERVPEEDQKLLVYEFSVRDPTKFLEALDNVAAAWQSAWESKDPAGLPECPSWAIEKCPLAERCGCRT